MNGSDLMKRSTAVVLASVALSACGEREEEVKALTPEQQSAYEECLEQSQAVADAWENIQQRCRDQVLGAGLQLPD